MVNLLLTCGEDYTQLTTYLLAKIMRNLLLTCSKGEKNPTEPPPPHHHSSWINLPVAKIKINLLLTCGEDYTQLTTYLWQRLYSTYYLPVAKNILNLLLTCSEDYAQLTTYLN